MQTMVVHNARKPMKMIDKSRLGCTAWLLSAVLCAGCGPRSTGPLLVADAAKVAELRNTTASKGAEPEAAEETVPAEAPTEWGDLSGQFLYEGTAPSAPPITVTKDEQVCGKHKLVEESLLVGPQNGLKNVVVFIATSKKQKLFVHPDYEASAGDVVRFDNKNCRFEPHVLPMRVSQTLELHNSDAISHNSSIAAPGEATENPLLGNDGTFDYHFKKPKNDPVKVTCSIHPWMNGYVVPRDNPYVAVTNDAGRFTIEKLPPGKYEFVVWHERARKPSLRTESVDLRKGKFKWDVKPGANDLGTLRLAAGAFE
jgi:plastocyanin